MKQFKLKLMHHYGWSRHCIQAKTLKDAAYKAVRNTHHFLTDDNHDYKVGPSSFHFAGNKQTYLRVEILKNDNSPNTDISLFHPHWFSVEYMPVKAKKELS
jgi:hypothetical protein